MKANHYAETDPDVRLMLQVRAGDAAAFEELVRRYQPRLLTVLSHWVGNHQHAEDLTQEVFLRVFRAREKYEPKAKFSTWLFTIAHNVARNARRASANRREVQVVATAATSANSSANVGALENLAIESSGLMPSRQFANVERAAVLHQAIQALNERQRMALLLCKFEGMSYLDIAEAMGMSTKATKSLLARARENLRAILEPYIGEGEHPKGNEG